MRQEHRYGEKVFIDFSNGLSFIDLATGVSTANENVTLSAAKMLHFALGQPALL
jgi:hypothetical protein